MSGRRHKWGPICDPPRDLFRPVRIDPSGKNGPTRAQAGGRKWRKVASGWYVPSYVEAHRPEQRIVEAAVLLPPDSAMTGWASARLHGANFLDGLLPDGQTEVPVPMAVPPSRNGRRRDGLRLLRSALNPAEVVICQGVPCTRPERAAFDAMRTAPDLREAVVVLDMMMAAELTSIRRVRAYVEDKDGWEGVEKVRAALDLADEHSRSPNETRMRLIWVLDARFPRPLVNRHVWDLAGKLLGIADLLDPDAGVVGEFDGADHRGALRHSKDEDRAHGFRRHQLEMFRVTGPDLPDRPKVVARMRNAREDAKWLPPGRRPWTIVPPPGWEPVPSLDELLDERDAVRAENERWEREREQVEAELRAEHGRLS